MHNNTLTNAYSELQHLSKTLMTYSTNTTTTEKPMETETETEEEVETFDCDHCGTTYEDEDESLDCCFVCSECGDAHAYESDADDCCNYHCEDCGEYFTSSDSADECCASSAGSMGTSHTAPWTERGHTFSSTENPDNMSAALAHWGIPQRPSPIKGAADYYLLEIISNDLYQATGSRAKHITPEVIFNMKHMLDVSYDEMRIHADNMTLSPFERLMFEASIQTAEQVELFDRVLLAYCQMAVGGELRHHQAVGGVVIDPPSRRAAAWFSWKDAVEEVGPEIFLDAASLFREITGGSYGGDKWAVPCEIVHMRLTDTLGPTPFMNRKLFVDRVWTLEHNGGCFLNKVDWPDGLSGIKPILDAHASNPENLNVLWGSASEKVSELFIKYLNMTAENNPEFEIDFDFETANKNVTYCRYCYGNAGHHLGCNQLHNHLAATKMKTVKGIVLMKDAYIFKMFNTPPLYNMEAEANDEERISINFVIRTFSPVNKSWSNSSPGTHFFAGTVKEIKEKLDKKETNVLIEHSIASVEIQIAHNANSEHFYADIEVKDCTTYGDVLRNFNQKVL